MDFDDDEDSEIEAIKADCGIKQTTELMRYLIRKEYKSLVKK